MVNITLMDGEFGHLRGALAEFGVTLNETSWDEHVGEVVIYQDSMSSILLEKMVSS